MNIEVILDQLAQACIDDVQAAGVEVDEENVCNYVDSCNFEDEVKDRVRTLLNKPN